MNIVGKKKRLLICGVILTLLVGLISVLTINANSNLTTASAASFDYSQYIFDPINNGEEYSVRAANRTTIEIADIPFVYNGKRVTEIANNGFAACTKLTKVTIPRTIKRIGNSAFMGSSNLTTVFTFENLDNEKLDIGTNAFYNCTKMNNVVIPRSVRAMASGAFKNVTGTIHVKATKEEAIARYDSNWIDPSATNVVYASAYSVSEVSYSPIVQNGTTTGYYVGMQGFEDYPDVEIKHTYNNLPVEYVEIMAFTYNNVNKLTIQESTNNHKIQIHSNAFWYSGIREVDCGNSVVFQEGNTESNGQFSLSPELTKVTLPNNVASISESMFESCIELETLAYKSASFTNTVPSTIANFAIRKDAFKDCISLGTLTNGKREFFIPANVTKVGENAFSGWSATNQRISVNLNVKPGDWSGDWKGTSSVEVAWKKFLVNFYDYNGGLYKAESGVHGDKITIPSVPEIQSFYSKWSGGVTPGQTYTITSDATFRAERNGEKPLSQCQGPDGWYEIYTVNQFKSVRDYASYGYNFYLNSNIDLGMTQWTPIPEFRGNFSGGGRTISGLYISTYADGNYGLFGINYGYISNLTVKGSIAIRGGSGGAVYAGLLCGQNNEYINYCNTYMETNAGISFENEYVTFGVFCERDNSQAGGIVGRNNRTIFNSKNYANVVGSGDLGGIAGYSRDGLTNCTNSGSVNYIWYSASNRCIGGVVGVIDGGVVTGCSSSGNVYYRSARSEDRNLAPYMGTVAGRLIGTSAVQLYKNNTSTGTMYADNLQVVTWKELLFFTKTHDQRQFVGGTVGYMP